MRVRGLVVVPALLCLLVSSGAWAQATRTWVSGVGDDVNPCSRTAPCKTFQGAISKTAVGGEIDALDPGGFGGLTITKAITLDGAGTLAGILVSGTNAVQINAPGAAVILRNLSFNGLGTGTDAIRVTAAASVTVENCTVSGFTGSLVHVVGTAGTQVFIRNSSLSGDGFTGTAAVTAANGLLMESGSAVVEKSQLSRAVNGIEAQGGAKVTVHDSTLVGNTGFGVHATGSAQVTLERGVVSHNATGVSADAPALVRLSDVMVGFNAQGVQGNVASFGNNRVAAGNATDGAPSTQLNQN